MENYDNIKAPWLSSYGEVPARLTYSEKTMYGRVMETVAADGDFPALSFMGRKITFAAMAESIDAAARAFYAAGVRPGDRVMVCLPNIPQAIYCLYGLNKIGATACMVHPMSAVGEIVYYIKDVECSYAVTMDQFYKKFQDVLAQVKLRKLIITRISKELPAVKAVAYKLMTERKIPKVVEDGCVTLWDNFLAAGSVATGDIEYAKDSHAEAVVLFSGGTTGVSKGIMLSDYNFNALALQTEAMCNETVRHAKMLAAMPVFHGFGLGVCIHTMMVCGGTSILVPKFNVKSYAKLIKDNEPNFIAGVPTLFEAITRNKYLDGADLSCLRGVFSGGDSLSIELKKKFDKFLADHKAGIRVREGYGTTECVTACCLTPYNKEKVGSIGLPFPDTYFKICKVGTTEEVAYGEEGEICICGPSVMLGYINHPEENAHMLQTHADGHVWLHTGDLGVMDEEGFVYFRQRIKRMIITSGYNVYPSQIENVIEGHEAVQRSCVIGVDDAYKMQIVKAFIVLKEGWEDSPELRESIMAHCRKNVAKYALPKQIEIRESLPTTLVGKVAYTKLEQEEKEKAAK